MHAAQLAHADEFIRDLEDWRGRTATTPMSASAA